MSEIKLTAVYMARKICQDWPGSFRRIKYIKHWGVILHRYYPNDKQYLTPQIIEANKRHKDGILFCEVHNWEGPKRTEWEDTPGFKLEPFELDKREHIYYDEGLQDYINSFNNEKQKYHIIFRNCHKFVLDLLCHLDLDEFARKLIPMSTTPEHLSLLSKSSSSSCKSQMEFPKLLRKVEETEVKDMTRTSWGNDFFIQDADSAIKTKARKLFPAVASQSIQLLNTKPNFFVEETSPWRYIHVLVEVIVGQLMVILYPKEKDLPNLVASSIEGELVPTQDKGEIAIWLIREAINFLIKLTILKSTTQSIEACTSKLNNIIGPRRILGFYSYAKDSMLEGAIKYIESVKKKELEVLINIEDFEDVSLAHIEEVNPIFYV